MPLDKFHKCFYCPAKSTCALWEVYPYCGVCQEAQIKAYYERDAIQMAAVAAMQAAAAKPK
jgi:hypothetical protein